MKILEPPDFLSHTKRKWLLFDTCVFIDGFINPTEFGKFFNYLTDNEVTLVTINAVLIEFLKGTLDAKKYQDKKEYVENIIDTYLPTTNDIFVNSLELIKSYKEDGKTLSVTDLLLGGTLMSYPSKLLLLTKNTTDFPTNIFELKTYLNLVHRKSIQSYGVYTFVTE